MRIGYARVSRQDQKLSLQIDALKEYGVERIFEEKVTGTRKNRPELDALLDHVRAGDTVVIWKLDRIGQSLRHLVELVNRFSDMGVNFVSLTENIDTTTATGRFVFNMFASLAEFERGLIVERTKAGLESARARGRAGGRPQKDENSIRLALKLYHSKQFTISQITQASGVSKATLYRRIRDGLPTPEADGQ